MASRNVVRLLAKAAAILLVLRYVECLFNPNKLVDGTQMVTSIVGAVCLWIIPFGTLAFLAMVGSFALAVVAGAYVGHQALMFAGPATPIRVLELVAGVAGMVLGGWLVVKLWASPPYEKAMAWLMAERGF